VGPVAGALDQRLPEMVIDATETADAYAPTKLIEHPHIRHPLSMWQPRERTPSPLFGQQPLQLVKRMGWGQQH